MNLILSGLPGTGKSSLMYSIASHLNKDISTIDFNSNKLSDHSFICATDKIPDGSIFCLEDVDALYIERQKKEENRVSFSCILNFLDGVYSKGDLITIITTNHIERLDKALIRPMRIDNIINFTHCSKYQYNEIFKLIFPDKDDIREQLYKIIKNKKYTTSMLQKFFIRFIYEPEKLIDNIKEFEELINISSEKDSNMFL
jgi:chaperone BCS1